MNEEQKDVFCQRLKSLRRLSGRTQAEISDEMHISRSALSNYEVGKRSPSIEMIRYIADYYKVDVTYLLAADETNDNSEELAMRRLLDFKYLIKGRFLDLSDLSDLNKIELLDYYKFLKNKDMHAAKKKL